jgi:hypothetical protein
MTLGAISLNAPGRAAKTGAGIALKSFVDREGEIAVGACRDRSRLIVGHVVDNSARYSILDLLSTHRLGSAKALQPYDLISRLDRYAELGQVLFEAAR